MRQISERGRTLYEEAWEDDDACFARLSTLSLCGIPEWDGIHKKMEGYVWGGRKEENNGEC